MGASGPIGPGATGSFERASQFGGPAGTPGAGGRVRADRPHAARRPARADRPDAAGRPVRTTRLPARADRADRPPGQYGTPQRGQVTAAGHAGGPSTGRPATGGPMPRASGPCRATRPRTGSCRAAGCPVVSRAPRAARAADVRTASAGPARPAPAAPVQYGQPMSGQYGETGPYERPHDDWSGPMERIGPSAAAPRYAAGNYNDWSGPLERIDPAAPPSRYGAPAHYGSPGQYGTASTARASIARLARRRHGQYGGTGQYGRPRAEPRYERTGEIDRSGQYAQPQYAQAQYGAGRVRPPSTASPVRVAVRPAVPHPAPRRRSTARPGTGPLSVRPGRSSPVSRGRASASGPAAVSSGRIRRQYQQSAGYEPGPRASTRRPCGTRSPSSTTSTSATTRTSARPGGPAGPVQPARLRPAAASRALRFVR